MTADLSKYKKVFLGNCKGVGLLPRGVNDNHVCFVILTEDDGNWYESNNSSSAYWITDLMKVLEQVYSWMETDCIYNSFDGYSFEE